MYYIGSAFKIKQGMEVLNLYFKDTPYYLVYANLKEESHKAKFIELYATLKENLNIHHDNFSFVLIDHEKVTK
jgi:hypothetical protein